MKVISKEKAIEQFSRFLEYEDCYTNEFLESVKTAISAIKNQIPQKPIKEKLNLLVDTEEEFFCPHCSKMIAYGVDGEWSKKELPKYCAECGQALDWREV